MSEENGIEQAILSFHKHLPVRQGLWQVEVTETSRKVPIKGWETHSITDDSGSYFYLLCRSFSPRVGYLDLTLERYRCPPGWVWVDEWSPLVTTDTDADGWRYAKTIGHGHGHRRKGNTHWHTYEGHFNFARMRKLVR